jgi:Xaa-Pro dipeptidase
MGSDAKDLEATYPAHLETLLARTARALEATGFDALVIHSGAPPAVFLDDQNYPFRANGVFKVWVPLTDVPDCFLIVRPGDRPTLLFHRPEDYWHKPADLPSAYWTQHFDLRPIRDREAARALLPQGARVAYIGEWVPEAASWRPGSVNPAALITRLDYDRATKTPYELACLREANRRGACGHMAAAQAFRDGASEFEIELAFLRACGQREQELPYNPIIALNSGAAVLHYQVLERTPPAQRHSLLIDAGAGFAGYASDITRTYAQEGSDFATLVNEMDQLQQSLCASVRAGVDWRDVHLSAHRLVAELLHDADIIYCGPEEALDTGLSSVFLPHGLGHLLGAQVHDVGGLLRGPEGGEIPRPHGHPFLRLTRVLEEGFVVTMEPGLYFIDQLLAQARADHRGAKINWARVEQLRPYGGIRIEDDLAITRTGCENLTRDAFAAVGG